MLRPWLRRFGVIVFVWFVLACSGGGCTSGCAGCGVTPLPGGFPKASAITNAASVRVTRSGLDFVQTNLGAIAGKVLGRRHDHLPDRQELERPRPRQQRLHLRQPELDAVPGGHQRRGREAHADRGAPGQPRHQRHRAGEGPRHPGRGLHLHDRHVHDPREPRHGRQLRRERRLHRCSGERHPPAHQRDDRAARRLHEDRRHQRDGRPLSITSGMVNFCGGFCASIANALQVVPRRPAHLAAAEPAQVGAAGRALHEDRTRRSTRAAPPARTTTAAPASTTRSRRRACRRSSAPTGTSISRASSRASRRAPPAVSTSSSRPAATRSRRRRSA